MFYVKIIWKHLIYNTILGEKDRSNWWRFCTEMIIWRNGGAGLLCWCFSCWDQCTRVCVLTSWPRLLKWWGFFSLCHFVCSVVASVWWNPPCCKDHCIQLRLIIRSVAFVFFLLLFCFFCFIGCLWVLWGFFFCFLFDPLFFCCPARNVGAEMIAFYCSLFRCPFVILYILYSQQESSLTVQFVCDSFFDGVSAQFSHFLVLFQ